LPRSFEPPLSPGAPGPFGAPACGGGPFSFGGPVSFGGPFSFGGPVSLGRRASGGAPAPLPAEPPAPCGPEKAGPASRRRGGARCSYPGPVSPSWVFSEPSEPLFTKLPLNGWYEIASRDLGKDTHGFFSRTEDM